MSPEAWKLYRSQPEKSLTHLRVGIIGGGPAGALTGLLLAREGTQVTIFEPRPRRTPQLGEKLELCVGCAGLLQENSIALLDSLGLNIPPEVIQTKLKSNVIHFPGGETIELPLSAMTVYRGFGPVGQKVNDEKIIGFDAWLLNEAEKAGANIIEAAVIKVRSDGEGVELVSNETTIKADLAVGSYGHNKLKIELPAEEKPLGEPIAQPACVREYYLGEETVKDKLKESQHIFGNPTQRIWYASIFPKRGFISIALMGREGATQGDFKEFLALKTVQELIGNLEGARLSCGCTSSITVRSPETFTLKNKSGGFLLTKIGDAGASRPRKNGIFAALDSAVKLAEALKMYGNSAKAQEVFSRYITTNYVWDNLPSELALHSIDPFLNYEIPRKLIVSLSNGNVPVVSKAVRETIELVSTGKAPYWQIPTRVLFNYPKDQKPKE